MDNAGVEVMESAATPEGHRALAVGDVIAEPEVPTTGGARRAGFRGRPIRLARRGSSDRPMRPLLVVGEPEGVELTLELGHAPRQRALPEISLESLVEALDLALRLRMGRRAVLLSDPEIGEEILEVVAATREARGVDRAVVGERGGRPAVGVARGSECRDDIVARDPGAGRAREQVTGVVVEPADDLDLGPVREAPVGEVGLPELVGRGRLEADRGAARALVRLGHDEARCVEDAPDRRGRRNRQLLASKMPADRRRTGVEAAGDKLGSELDDPVTHLPGRPLRAAMWAPRLRPDGFERPGWSSKP